MFWETKNGLKFEFIQIIDFLRNSDCIYPHLSISHVDGFINPKQKIGATWEDTCQASPPIITETININEMVEQILNDYIPGLNYIMCIYEESKNKRYLNVFNVRTKEHFRIELHMDLFTNSELYFLNIPEYICKYQNIKNIHKDIKSILKKFKFETIDIMPEILTLII